MCLDESIDCTNVVLRAGPLELATHSELERELASIDLVPGFIESMREERALELQAFGPAFYEPLWKFRLRNWLVKDECDFIDATNKAIGSARLPYGEWNREMDSLVRSNPAGPHTEDVLHWFNTSHDTTIRTTARLRALRILNALGDGDANPMEGDVALDTLGLPVDATTDPFNGKPLIVKRLPEGWQIYSVSVNLVDDGGNLEFEDVGVAPPVARQLDDPSGEQSATEEASGATPP
jgi:hypothetical protein